MIIPTFLVLGDHTSEKTPPTPTDGREICRGRGEMEYGFLTLTFDKDEAILAPTKDIKNVCEACEYFDECDWENEDCISKLIDVEKSGIKYDPNPDRWLGRFYRR